MKALHKFCFLGLLALGLFSCENEDLIRMPELIEGANMRIVVDASKKSFSLASIASGTVEFDAYSINTNLQKVEFIGNYISGKDSIKNQVLYSIAPSAFVSGKARGVISSADVVKAFKLADATKMKAGDRIELQTHVTLTDGRVVSPANSAQSILQGVNASFTAFVNFDIKP
jgi:hypothetical protein